ncbi:MAG TPA: ATP-dependent helicase HrpB, partial [Thiotrichales bacterium]|nr:ATP-dependent helicase HrpB [Thiotrichales bacterium]
MPDLPIYDVVETLQRMLAEHQRVVLQAPPGAGKTTVVPIELLAQPWLADRQIILLEPRRLAARNAAARMASILGEATGETVGYQIRQERCTSQKTRILVVTEGILTRKLQADPELADTALVIFDEFHERSLHADLSLALCLQSQQILREDLKILVMSATLNTGAISDLLDNAPVIQSEGRCYPVELHYADREIKHGDRQQFNARVFNTVKQLIERHTGSTLVFLPGAGEIRRLEAQLKQYKDSQRLKNLVIAPLYGNLGKQQQDQAISPAPPGKRKIVLATNIAETSLTIDGIDCVVDSGLERVMVYNPASSMNSLQTQRISSDSAEQRAGRAGRLAPGHCYRLWTEQQQRRMVKHAEAEILHSDLSSLVLEMANWGVQQADELRWLDLPPKSAIDEAGTLLQKLGALDDVKKITRHGRDMLKIGTHPRLAHMLLESIEL